MTGLATKESSFLSVKLAPLSVPFPRRRQTAAVVLWMMLLPLCLALFLFLVSRTYLLPFALAYVIFIALDPAPETGGRKAMWFRRLSLWKWLADFFPASIVKTADLDPNKTYVFGYHPHGIISLGAFTNFATEATGFGELFNGIDLRLMTLEPNFRMPFFREIILHLGVTSASRRSCDNILTKGPGNAIMLVVGGAAEALNAFPGTNDLVLKKRYGFVKVALRTGSSLVPVMSFGENDIWDQVPNPQGSTLRKFQRLFQRYASFSPPLLHGRGIFTYNYGILPFRHPIVSVVGAPIDCPRTENPSNELVQEYHQKYLDALQALYDKYKDVYARDRVRDMCFVES
ncbi:diacylglycerol O-acyltransferase 1 [Polyrhizophydium stewartii]|uniref:Diacylglycerol O-acyltransferase n=1 Tax=Polyrhizophydium stewartii TaxID=2732419 RepID=A0ABR4N0N1_9FUNG|nr:diacylglycerol O-acyltransferase 1 [Polyrhizophydium stewartii]